MKTLKERNAKLNHSVIVMTYGLGNESESNMITSTQLNAHYLRCIAEFDVLRKMANEDGTLYGESAAVIS